MDQSNSSAHQIASVVAPYFVAAGDYSILADATAGAYNVYLPAASSSTGRELHVKKTDASANAVTLVGVAGETIEDAVSQPLTLQGENLMIICDGTQWRVL